jgi:hypothetical protein
MHAMKAKALVLTLSSENVVDKPAAEWSDFATGRRQSATTISVARLTTAGPRTRTLASPTVRAPEKTWSFSLFEFDSSASSALGYDFHEPDWSYFSTALLADEPAPAGADNDVCRNQDDCDKQRGGTCLNSVCSK